MFAEELTSSAARKRQEANRARRRQLKRQQQQRQEQKEKEKKTAAAVSSAAVRNGAAAGESSSLGAAGEAGASSSASSGDIGPAGSSAAAAAAAAPGAAVAAAASVAANSDAAAKAKGGATASTATAVTNKQSAMSSAVSSAAVSSSSAVSSAPTAASTGQMSAVEIAKQRRQLRAQFRARNTAATLIQSYYRTFQSNMRLRAEEGKLFDQRMSDLMTLGTILKRAGKGRYVPPPATVSAMTTQLLFLTGRIPHRRRRGRGGGEDAIAAVPSQRNGGKDRSRKGGSSSAGKKSKSAASSDHFADDDSIILDGPNLSRLSLFLRHVLLPGLVVAAPSQSSSSSSDDKAAADAADKAADDSDSNSLDPILPWLDSPHGRARLDKLLHLCVACLTGLPPKAGDDQISGEAADAAEGLVRLVLGLDGGRDDGGHGIQDGGGGTCGDDEAGRDGEKEKEEGRGGRARARVEVVEYCRSKLLLPVAAVDITAAGSPSSCSPTSSATSSSSEQQHPRRRHNLDLIRRTRTFLLYGMGGAGTGAGVPIPPDSERSREGCVSARDRTRADKAFGIALDAVLDSGGWYLSPAAAGAAGAGAGGGDFGGGPSNDATKLRSRFVEEILTVPLLTWKVSPAVTSSLIGTTTNNANAPPSKSTSTTTTTNTAAPLVKVPLVRVLLRSFATRHAGALSNGAVRSILPSLDVPPAVCPAPAVMCLLANLVQLGRVCTSINGTDGRTMDLDAAALFFDVLSTLLDAAPLGCLSSRRSAVEWVSDGTYGSHHTPIVLSGVVIEQCRAILVDSYVRGLFMCAIDDGVVGTDGTISTKNDRDRKYEREMAEVGGESAASLAAREAMVDRTRGFWRSSRWARKLSKSVSTLLSGDAAKAAPKSSPRFPKGGGKLVNTSSVSRQLAKDGSGQGGGNASGTVAANGASKDDGNRTAVRQSKYTTDFLFALCRAYGSILARWGGSGKDDIVRRTTTAAAMPSKNGPRTDRSDAADKADPLTVSLLNVMCFATGITKTLWAIVQSDNRVVSALYTLVSKDKGNPPIRSLEIRAQYDNSSGSPAYDGSLGPAVLFVFLTTLAHVLIVTDDIEIHDMGKPLPPHQLRRCILLLKSLLYRACCVDDVNTDPGGDSLPCDSNYFGLALIAGASKTMRDLYDRSSRRPLCVPKLWLVEDLLEKEIRRCKHHEDFASVLSLPVLRVCPFLVSFKRRLRLFERIVTTDRIAIQGSNEQHDLRPGVVVRIMRGRVLEDGLIHLNNLGRNLRQRIVVQYISQAGATETGVDVGGLFKEFWSDLSNLAFDPNYALFRATEGSGNCLYPNPSSRAAHGSDHIILFEFLGRILGKALYEGITIQPQFAHFFLSFLRGDYNFLHMLPDLSTMDPQLYNNLMFLKTYEGDASDLCLTFTIANDDFGGNEEVPLIPNGANIEVTNSNKQRYIGLVAKYHVCDRVKEQSQAFTRGLWEVIDRKWLLLFNEPELQVLISGASDGRIDVSDMKAHTRYAGGYSGLDKHVHRFWNVVSSFSPKEQADLLRFVTSCERPPPLGFTSMNPPFTIQRVGIMRDGDKLPSASTCFNTLKLPTYSSEKVLKQRLLYAIQAGAGFELT